MTFNTRLSTDHYPGTFAPVKSRRARCEMDPLLREISNKNSHKNVSAQAVEMEFIKRGRMRGPSSRSVSRYQHQTGLDYLTRVIFPREFRYSVIWDNDPTR